MIALAYLATVVAALLVLVVAVGRHRTPAPTPPPAPPAETGLPAGAEADIRLILVTAAQLAARLAPAA